MTRAQNKKYIRLGFVSFYVASSLFVLGLMGLLEWINSQVIGTIIVGILAFFSFATFIFLIVLGFMPLYFDFLKRNVFTDDQVKQLQNNVLYKILKLED